MEIDVREYTWISLDNIYDSFNIKELKDGKPQCCRMWIKISVISIVSVSKAYTVGFNNKY